MDNMAFVGGSERVCHLNGIACRFARREWAFRKELAQRLSHQQFGNNVGSAALQTDVIDGEDVGMIQGGGGAGLLLKTAQVVGIVARAGPDQLQTDIDRKSV